MAHASVRIAIVPQKRGRSKRDSVAGRKRRALEYFSQIAGDTVEFVDVDSVVDGGMVQDDSDVAPVVRFLTEQKVDGVFLLFVDFGWETAAAKIAKEVGKPVLVYGPRDQIDLETGIRSSNDTQCGIIAATKVLQVRGVPFSYIVNVDLDDPRVAQGFMRFARVVSVVKALGSMKVALFGQRPKPFMSVMANESELLSRFGIEVVPIYPVELQRGIESVIADRPDELAAERSGYEDRIDVGETRTEVVERGLALKLTAQSLMEKYGCTTAAISCWAELHGMLGTTSCMTVSELTNAGLPVACEADVNGAVTLGLIQAADFNRSIPFFPDLTIRHPENPNAELLWHCGPFPYGLKHPESTAKLVKGQVHWQLEEGPLTVARFDGVDGRYQLFAGEGRAIDGPRTHGAYVWLEVDDWERWERALVYGPYIHHVACVYGHYASVLHEACKYIPGLSPDGPEGRE
jgi:L-fucose isomerase-like protein